MKRDKAQFIPKAAEHNCQYRARIRLADGLWPILTYHLQNTIYTTHTQSSIWVHAVIITVYWKYLYEIMLYEIFQKYFEVHYFEELRATNEKKNPKY